VSIRCCGSTRYACSLRYFDKMGALYGGEEKTSMNGGTSTSQSEEDVNLAA